jgi:hypothetical protein
MMTMTQGEKTKTDQGDFIMMKVLKPLINSISYVEKKGSEPSPDIEIKVR